MHSILVLASILVMIAAMPILGDVHAQTAPLADIIDTAEMTMTNYDPVGTNSSPLSTIELTFKKPVTGVNATTTFLIDGNPTNSTGICGTTTTPKCILTVQNAFRPDATPTVTIARNQSFTSGGTDLVTYNRGSVTAMDKVKPEVVEQMTKITGPNTIIVVYEEAVTATLADYADLKVGRGTYSPSFTGAPSVPLASRNLQQAVSGSGTDTHVLTFVGNPAETSFTGTMRVNNTVKDLADNTIEPDPMKTYTLATLRDGQSPRLVSVSVTNSTAITATWSEPVFEPNSAVDGYKGTKPLPPAKERFTDIRLSGVSSTLGINGTLSNPVCNAMASECKYAMPVGGLPSTGLLPSASGVMTISTLVDYMGNQISRIPNVSVSDGQAPTITRASIKMTGPNQFSISSGAGGEPLRAETSTFTDLKVDHDGDSNVSLDCRMVPIKICADGRKIASNATCPQINCRDVPDRGGTTRVCDNDPGTSSSEPRCTISSGTNTNATPMQDRNVTGVTTGSDANGLVITFDGEPVKTNATGDVKIQKTLTDFGDNIVKLEAGTSGNAAIIPDDGSIGLISDGQAPQVISAKVLYANVVQLEFSEQLQTADCRTNTNPCNPPKQTAEFIFGGNSTSGKQVVQVHGKTGTTTVNGTSVPCEPYGSPTCAPDPGNNFKIMEFFIGFVNPLKITGESGTSITNSINDAGDLVNHSDNSVQPLPGVNDSVGLLLSMVNDTNGNILTNQRVTAIPAQTPEIESMLITGPKEITVKFNKSVQKSGDGIVNPDSSNFRDIRIPPGSNIVRSIDQRAPSNGIVPSMGNSTFTLTLNIPNDKPLPTDAVGTMTIQDVTDRNDIKVLKRDLPTSTDLNLGDGRPPLVESASISGPNKVTIVFTEPVTAKMSDFGDKLGMLKIGIGTGDNADNRKITSFAKPDVDTVELTFEGEGVKPDATGTIEILKSVKDTSQGENDLGYQTTGNDRTCTSYFYANRTTTMSTGMANLDARAGNVCALVDGQKPMLNSIAITGKNTITAKFTEAVTQGMRDGGVADGFTGFRIGEDDYRNTNISILSTGTDEVDISFGGSPAGLNASGIITITDDIEDMNKNKFVPLTDYPVRAGQIPAIEKAEFTAPNQLTITFTENVTLPNATSHFTNLRVTGESADRTITAATLEGRGNMALVTFGGDAVSTGATGRINISGAIDYQQITMEPATNIVVQDGQKPKLMAKVTGPNTVTAMFTEPVTATAVDFGEPRPDNKRTLNLGGTGGTNQPDEDVRLITSFSRAAPDAFTITFDGMPAGTNTAIKPGEGFITVSKNVVDLSENYFDTTVGGTRIVEQEGVMSTITVPSAEPISDGQNPTLYRAEFGEGKYLEIAYSENVNAPRGSYFALTFEGGMTRDLTDRSHTGDRHHLNYVGATINSQSAMMSVGSEIEDEVENPLVVSNGTIKVYPNENPRILRAAITQHNEITLTFSEPVKDVTKSMFSIMVQNGGAPKTVKSLSGLNTDTILLKFADNSFETGTTGTMRISEGIKDMLDKPLGAISSQNLLPLQLQSITSAQLTAPNQITITFNDPVRATSANFENLSIITDGASSGRSVTDATGTGTNTITLTFDGEPASTGATARIDIVRITGTDGQSYAPLTNTQITDGQAPMLSIVTISSSNDDNTRAFPDDTVTLRFTASENIRQPILTINENSVVALRGENNQWSAVRTITMEDLDRESKIVQFTIDYTDTAGIAGAQVAMTTDDSMVTMSVPDATISGTVCVTAENDDDCDSSDPIYTSTPPYAMYLVPPANSGMMWDGNPHRTAPVDQDTGKYTFENVTPNIEWVVQTTYFPSGLTVKNDATSWYTRVTPTPGQEFTFDMPFYRVPQSERNTLELRTYNDINQNRVRDAGEDGIPNLTFRAYTYLSNSYEDIETGANGAATKNDMMRGDWALLHPEGWIITSIEYQRTDSTSGKQYKEDHPVVDDPAPGSIHTMTFGMYRP